MKTLLMITCMGLLLASPAYATLVSNNFTGSVQVLADSNNVLSDAGFSLGQSFSVGFIYQDTTLCLSCSPTDASAQYANALTAITVTVGSYTATTPILLDRIQIDNDVTIGAVTYDQLFLIERLSGTQINGHDPQLVLGFYDSSGTAWSDVSLTSVNLTNWMANPNHNASWNLSFGDQGGIPLLSGTLASVSPVPEPSTLLLLASGLAGLGGMAWRRRKQ